MFFFSKLLDKKPAYGILAFNSKIYNKSVKTKEVNKVINGIAGIVSE